MALLQEWRDVAYSQTTDKKQMQQFWSEYFLIEKGIYEKLLSNPDEVVSGTVKELAEKYEISVQTMTGFLDGINDSLKEQNPIEEMTEDTVVNLGFDKELLYKNMVDAKADWLYELPMWDEIFDAETKKNLYKEAKKMNTIVKGKKIGRNDPCPCGSGKKYKYCCMPGSRRILPGSGWRLRRFWALEYSVFRMESGIRDSSRYGCAGVCWRWCLPVSSYSFFSAKMW